MLIVTMITDRAAASSIAPSSMENWMTTVGITWVSAWLRMATSTARAG